MPQIRAQETLSCAQSLPGSTSITRTSAGHRANKADYFQLFTNSSQIARFWYVDVDLEILPILSGGCFH
jgi:hypothetical protein